MCLLSPNPHTCCFHNLLFSRSLTGSLALVSLIKPSNLSCCHSLINFIFGHSVRNLRNTKVTLLSICVSVAFMYFSTSSLSSCFLFPFFYRFPHLYIWLSRYLVFTCSRTNTMNLCCTFLVRCGGERNRLRQI